MMITRRIEAVQELMRVDGLFKSRGIFGFFSIFENFLWPCYERRYHDDQRNHEIYEGKERVAARHAATDELLQLTFGKSWLLRHGKIDRWIERQSAKPKGERAG